MANLLLYIILISSNLIESSVEILQMLGSIDFRLDDHKLDVFGMF